MADAVYLTVADRPIAWTTEWVPNRITVDFAEDGAAVGVEILAAASVRDIDENLPLESTAQSFLAGVLAAVRALAQPAYNVVATLDTRTDDRVEIEDTRPGNLVATS